MADEASRRNDFEDIVRVVTRRKGAVLACVVVFALLAVAYSAAGSNRRERVEVSLGVEEPLSFTTQLIPKLNIEVESARFDDELDDLLGVRANDVTVRADTARDAMIVSAVGPTEADATTLALDTARKFTESRTHAFTDRLESGVESSQRRADAIAEQLAQLDSDISELGIEDSAALRDQRLELVQAKLDEEREVDRFRSTIDLGNVGLVEPIVSAVVPAQGRVGLIIFGILGAMLGLLVGVAAALGLDSLDHRLYTRRDVVGVSGTTFPVSVLRSEQGDPFESSEVALLRGHGSERPVIVRSPASARDDRLDELGLDIVADVASLPPGAGAIVGVRQGHTTDVELVHQLSNLDVSGNPVVALLLYEVPRQELDWARRR